MKLTYIALAALTAAHLWFYQHVMQPLRLLSAQAKRLSGGDFTALEKGYGGISEIDTLRVAMNAMVGHVRRAQAQEWSYIEALTNGQEAERTRIARELHDDTTQSLVAIAQSLEIAQGLIVADSPARPMLQLARTQAIQAIDNLRRLIANLRPPILAELGLVPALQMLAESTHQANVEIATIGVARRLSEMKELVFFRSAQEAIWNAIRHGQASHIKLQIEYCPDNTKMIIQDNGIGFDVPQNLDMLSSQGHFGLVGMSERIQHLEGSLKIGSQAGNGTRIEITIPVQETIQPDGIVRDPVCSALIEPNQAYSSVTYEGERYYFCCPVCEGAFQASPVSYLHSDSQRNHAKN
jgi:signal transduction histidine kinase/YHS domain-containing protein